MFVRSKTKQGSYYKSAVVYAYHDSAHVFEVF